MRGEESIWQLGHLRKQVSKGRKGSSDLLASCSAVLSILFNPLPGIHIEMGRKVQEHREIFWIPLG